LVQLATDDDPMDCRSRPLLTVLTW